MGNAGRENQDAWRKASATLGSISDAFQAQDQDTSKHTLPYMYGQMTIESIGTLPR